MKYLLYDPVQKLELKFNRKQYGRQYNAESQYFIHGEINRGKTFGAVKSERWEKRVYGLAHYTTDGT